MKLFLMITRWVVVGVLTAALLHDHGYDMHGDHVTMFWVLDVLLIFAVNMLIELEISASR